MARVKTSGKASPRKAGVKAVSRKTAVKKAVKKTTRVTEGSRYSCDVCGLAVTVDNACCCAEGAHLICCEQPMKKKR
ncbi:MAG TPA: hypothetical protein VFG09_02975 [Thermodesulfovibrionales bacterium]|nr:hypothetical protein [Thermodesulfovibrionales bacterium]